MTSKRKPSVYVRWIVISLVMAMTPFLLAIEGLELGRITRSADFDFIKELEQRKRGQAERIDQPAVIFVGGSNVRFGIDSESLSKRIGRPVVNYGLHAGLERAPAANVKAVQGVEDDAVPGQELPVVCVAEPHAAALSRDGAVEPSWIIQGVRRQANEGAEQRADRRPVQG